MPRTNLSLGNLYRAVSGSARTSQAVSIGGLSGGTSNSSFTAFAIDSVTPNLPTFTYIVESTEEAATFSFGTAGTLHGTKVGNVAANYSVTFNNGNFTVGSPTLGASPSFPITPASIAQSTYSEASSVLSMKYEDGYNLAATGYNSTSTKTLYAVDVYNTINQPDFCLLFGTKITKADGTIVNVEDLSVGDTIKAWVPDGLPDEDQDSESDQVDWRFYMLENQSGSYQEVNVADIVFNFASGYYDLNNGLIKSTGTHPLWVWDSEIEKYRFKNVEDVLPGDLVVTYDSVTGLNEIEITDIEVIIEDVEIVTLNVENADVYLANGIVSHNKGTTTQPPIPAAGLRLYLDPSKASSTNGTVTTDWLDLSGYNTGVRPAGVANAAGITGDNPSYNNGATRKDKYFAGNGTNQFWYKDTTTNINGGYSQFNTNTGTIHVWVRPTTTLGVASRHIFDYAGFYGLAIESSDSSTLNRVKFYGSTLGNSAQLTTSLSSNVWYMISATFQPSGTVTVYVDKTSVGTFTASAFTAPSSTNFLTIGCNSGRTTFWNGQIGPVLFYNTLQNATSVGQVYDYFSPTYK
jgi:hypothetical protein